jgi:hypothetical protein|tara:strand:- start:210 stop:1766 length:1557 start_codon:yes stop_codon:yes gene_type:complete
MADKVVLEAEIKSNIGKVSKETKELTNDFGAFGITIGGIKDKFKDVAKIMNNGLKQVALQAKLAGLGFKQMFSGQIIGGAKTLFTVIKTGIAATGIGALVIAFTSLATFLTKTKKGAELLEVAFAGIGAAVSVIVDRVSKFGGAIVKLFQGNVKGALTDVKGAFKGIGTEIANDVKQAVALKKAFTSLRDSERALNVETAQRRAQIEALKLIAEDVTKSETERLNAAKSAFQIENDLLDKRVANAEEALRIQQQEMALGENMQEDLDKEAELLINLADIRAESTTKQIELNNKINSIEAEVAAKRKERSDARLKEIEDEKEAKLKAIEDEKKAADELYNAQIAQAKAFEANAKRMLQEEKARLKSKKDFEISMADQSLQVIGDAAGEGTAIAKAAAIAQATISGVQGVQNAFTAANANIGATAGTFGAYPVTMAALAGTFAAMNIAKIASGGGGGVTPPSTGGRGAGAAAATPAPQMMSGAFELSGGVAPEAMRAYVVTDEMTNSQNQLANIRRRATI